MLALFLLMALPAFPTTARAEAVAGPEPGSHSTLQRLLTATRHELAVEETRILRKLPASERPAATPPRLAGPLPLASPRRVLQLRELGRAEVAEASRSRAPRKLEATLQATRDRLAQVDAWLAKN
jgi:hypothetical protein